MSAKEVIDKIKVLLGGEAAPAETKPEDFEKQKPAEEAPADTKPEGFEEEKPAEEKPAEEKPADEKPAEEAPANEPTDTEKRISDLEGKVDELYEILQALVEKERQSEETDKPAPATAAPAQFAAAEEKAKPMTRAERILALKHLND